MELLVKVVFCIFISLCLLFYILYFPRFKAWFGSFKKQKRIYSEKKNKIAVLIPARNESKVIEELFKCFKRQTYDKEYFDVHVIVKEYDDPTILLTKEIDGFVHVINDQKCKGDCLDATLKKILKNNPNEYDGYLIIDADCIIKDDYLEEMNNAMASNKQIISSKRVVKNYLYKNNISYAGACNGLIWTLMDEMGNRYKSDHEITNMTIGTGILLRSDLVKKLNGWPYNKTLTEDIELMYDAFVNKYTTFFYSYAIIYVEEAESLEMTDYRRNRWLTGVVDSYRLYEDKIEGLEKTKENKKNKYYTTSLNLVYKYVGLIVFNILINLIFALFAISIDKTLIFDCLMISLFSFGLLYLSFFLLTVFCMIIDRKYIKLSLFRKIVVLFIHPLFYMGYIKIIGKALFFGGVKEWKTIERTEFIKEEEKSYGRGN